MTPGEPRQTIGPYEVQEVLGHGGMATVYRALQRDLDRTVALKVLLPAYLDDAAFRARFQLEARLVARLRHPNIVGIYDVSEDDGQPYLVMEYLEGITLHRALVERRQQGRLFSPQEALELLRPLASALDYAHSRNIVHRDLKPENIILTTDGPVITDFGLAKLLQEEAATVSIVMGTPAYMAPEQIEAQAVDARTDVYALGIMLYELLSGHVPYEGSSPVAVAQAHLSQPIPSLIERVPGAGLAREIETVAQRAIAKDKADRWPSAGAMIEALEDAVADAVIPPADRPTVALASAPPAGAPRRMAPPVPRVARPPQQERRSGIIVLLVPLLAVILAAFLGARYLLTPPMESASEAQPSPVPVVAGESATGETAPALTGTVEATLVPSPAGTLAPVATDDSAATATASPLPPTPTASGTPAPDSTVRGVVRAPTGAYLRGGPGTSYPVIGGLPDRAPVTAVEQAEGWLNVVAETGEQGWLAAVLFELQAGDIAALPQGEAPPLAQAPTSVTVEPIATSAPSAPTPVTAPVEPAPPVQPGTTLRLEDTSFSGGFRNSGSSIYGGRSATWVYGQGSGYSSMSASFTIDQPGRGVARLAIEGMDSGRSGQDIAAHRGQRSDALRRRQPISQRRYATRQWSLGHAAAGARRGDLASWRKYHHDHQSQSRRSRASALRRPGLRGDRAALSARLWQDLDRIDRQWWRIRRSQL